MTTLLYFLVVLSVLIFVHELGHFLVARLFGVGVERFSIGFGPRIAGWTAGRTDYRVSAIPLGGYVKMVGEEPDAELPEEELPFSFTHKPVWQRMLIVAAGPVFNLVLAVVLLWGLVFWYGIPVFDPVIGRLTADAPAEKAGLATGDLITKINDTPISSWQEMSRMVADTQEGESLVFTINRNGRIREKELVPENMPVPDLLGGTEMRRVIGATPYIPPVIGYVQEGMPAGIAGLAKGDVVLAVNGIKTPTWDAMAQEIKASEGNPLSIRVEREGTFLTLSMQAKSREFEDAQGKKISRFVVGISPEEYIRVKDLGIFASLGESVRQTGEIIRLTGVAVARMVTGSISKDNLGGPIMIAQMAGSEGKKGIDRLLAFIAGISVNLALLNLLPIPVLDGGHLLFYTIELLTGKPVGLRGREIAQQFGLVLLLTLMIFTFYNDIMRLITG